MLYTKLVVVVRRENNCSASVSALCVLLKLQKGTETENEIETEKRIVSTGKSKSQHKNQKKTSKMRRFSVAPGECKAR